MKIAPSKLSSSRVLKQKFVQKIKIKSQFCQANFGSNQHFCCITLKFNTFARVCKDFHADQSDPCREHKGPLVICDMSLHSI